MPDPRRFHAGRHAGVLIPLFSIPSSGSWGVGEIPDLPRLAAWLREAGLDFVQLLPVNEMEAGQSSPYSALSAMAIDPVFIGLHEVPELADGDSERLLDAAGRARLADVRRAGPVDFRTVRALKARALGVAFERFRNCDSGIGPDRRRDFLEFADRERWWLDDYGLFRALHDDNGGRYWRDWHPALRDRDPAALAQARERLHDRILYYEYLQWLAHTQWQRARRACGPVGIFGDFPFMVGGHSADVWARQHEFRVDASVGVPPEPPSEAGQDWGLPACRWEVMAHGGDVWLRHRIRRSVELFDGFRIDHLVGFYRTFVRERDGRGAFTPAGESAQLAHGERMMRLFVESGARILAEDLGTVPDFVRDSLRRLQVPGLKVLRWEREWHQPGQPFRRPAEYPAPSVAISGTHDTETLAEWWDSAPPDERRQCADIPELRDRGCDAGSRFSERTRDALLRTLYHAGSDLVILPIQDVFGWRARINVPAVVSDDNWTWRLPWPVDQLLSEPVALERAAFLRSLSQESHR